MSDTSSTFGAYAAADLIAAKAAGQQFTKQQLADRLDVLLEAWSQRPETLALETGEASPITAETIYQAYPRKIGKKAALKAITFAIQQLVKDGISTTTAGMTPAESAAAFLHEITRAYATAVETWPASERKYVPHPSTWFNQGRYMDDPNEWKSDNDRTTANDTPRNYSKI